MKTVDYILNCRWIAPVEPQTVLENHSLIILGTHIHAILPSIDAKQRYQGEQIDLTEHIVIPGLINAHTHSAMSLLRGIADDLPLMEWLQEHIWPIEEKQVNADFVTCGSQLAIAEMLQSGTTCFNDMYFYPEVTAQVAEKAGIRACIGMIVLDFPSVWAKNANEYIDKGLNIQQHYQAHPLINTAFAPHAPYSVSNEALNLLLNHAETSNSQIHMHIHETKDEIQQSLDNFSCRPLQRLNELNFLSSKIQAVHMCHLTADEIQLIHQKQMHIIHCPESNMKLGSGFTPVHTLLEHNINVALGTDGAASNNDLDMMGEMKSAALLAKAHSANPQHLPAHMALQMATLNGAKALNISHITGSLVSGKAADICAINLNHMATQPVYQPISNLVYSASRNQVTDVWVNGQYCYKQSQLTTLDAEKIIAEAQQWQKKIA